MLLFQILSGVKINFNKSVLYAYDPRSDLVGQCAQILGCQSGTWPFTYVRYQVGVSPKRRTFWRPILKKLKTRLSTWKSHILNKAG